MTIANEDARTGPYNGNGSTDVFAYDFKLLDEAHLVVTLTDSAGVDTVQVLSTDYTVSGVGDEGGGNVTMVTPPATGEQLTITRSVLKTQGVDLQNRGSFLPNTVEGAFDKLTQITQDLAEQLARAIKSPVTATTEFFFPTANADKVIGWNSAGTALENKTVNSDAYLTAPVSSTDNALVRFDGTTGRAWQNSGVNLTDGNNFTGVGSITMTGNIVGINFLNGTDINNYLLAADIGTTVQGFDADTLKADTSDVLGSTTKFTQTPNTLTLSGNQTISFLNSPVYKVTLTANITSLTLSGFSDGDVCELWIKNTGTFTISGFTHSTGTLYWATRDGSEHPVVSGANNWTRYQFAYSSSDNVVLSSGVDYI